MKKISLLGLAALTGLAAFAQESVLKEAERAMKANKTLSEVVTIITPAFTDPTTAEKSGTYYIPGKAGFKEYDNLFTREQLGQLDEAGKAQKVKALMGGYDYMMKALPLDAVTDAKGKVKTKYTKDIVNTVGGHYNDYYTVGVDAYNLKDYETAYNLWNAYATLPSNPDFAKVVKAPADTILSEILFNQGIAAWQFQDMQKALDAFLAAKNAGYDKQQVYDFAISVASAMQKNDVVTALAKEAYPKYGHLNPDYIGLVINDYINKEDYQQAMTAIDQAIAQSPDNAQYYVIKGILMETEGINQDPTEIYKKATEIDPKNAKALYNYGRMIYNKAVNIYDAAPNDPAEFNKIFNENFKPVMTEAVGILEQAADADQEDMEPLKLLENAYYLLNDETNMNITKQRLGR